MSSTQTCLLPEQALLLRSPSAESKMRDHGYRGPLFRHCSVQHSPSPVNEPSLQVADAVICLSTPDKLSGLPPNTDTVNKLLFNGFNQDTSGCLSPKPPSSPPITPLPMSPPKPLPPPPAPPAAPLPPRQPFREVLLGNGYCRVSGPDDRLTFVDTGCVSTQEECRANCHAFRNGCSCYSYTSPTEIEDDFDNCRPQALGRCNVYGDEQAFATSSGNQYYQACITRGCLSFKVAPFVAPSTNY